jgi:hypothetical protein
MRMEPRGFASGEAVTMTATMTNAMRSQSRAAFTRHDDGCVYIVCQATVSGNYDGVGAMGVICSTSRLPGEVHAMLPVPIPP